MNKSTSGISFHRVESHNAYRETTRSMRNPMDGTKYQDGKLFSHIRMNVVRVYCYPTSADDRKPEESPREAQTAIPQHGH